MFGKTSQAILRLTVDCICFLNCVILCVTHQITYLKHSYAFHVEYRNVLQSVRYADVCRKWAIESVNRSCIIPWCCAVRNKTH